ncbi:MAG: hypothetical protein IKG47_12320 [Oscillospiraceae bacterium]|nr:hypothetical protein [Oscillospiraceae bacterium]
MKKILSILLIVIIMMSLSSCGRKTVELSRGDMESYIVNTTMKNSYIDDCNDLDFVRSVIEKYGAAFVGKNNGIELYAVNVTPLMDGTSAYIWFIAINEGNKDMEFVRAEYKINGDDGRDRHIDKSMYSNGIYLSTVKAGCAFMVDVRIMDAPYGADELEDVELTLYINEPESTAKAKKWGSVSIKVQ